MKESKFQFTNPRLVSFTYQEKNNINNVDKFDMPCNSNINVQKSITDNTALVSLMLIIGIPDETPFTIAAEIKANFKWDDSFSDDMVDKMLKNNAASLLLSYLRPLIATLTNNTHFGPINIPFMDFRNSSESEAKPYSNALPDDNL